MKRDLDLIRELLLRLEGFQLRPGAGVMVSAQNSEFAVPGYDHGQVTYHFHQIAQSGFVEGSDTVEISTGAMGFRGLTPAGHDYLDAVRDPETWRKTKAHAKEAGGFSLGLIKDIGLAIIKGELQKHGLPLL